MSDEVVLAERRRKKKWTLNPRGKFWSDDNEKLGQKMLEKMGWSKGKGLGAKEQGMANPILVHGNNENKGLGFEGNPDQWLNHQEDFDDILASLNAANPTNEQSKTKKPTSLEKRSKSSKSRVHYHKFTRGKDLSNWKESDLACIFGKKSSGKRNTSRKAEETQEAVSTTSEANTEEEIGTVSNQHGVTVIKGGSMADYFAKKWNYIGGGSNSPIKEQEEQLSDVDERPSFSFGFTERAGFGANSWVSGGSQEGSELRENENEGGKRKKNKILKEDLSSTDAVSEVTKEKYVDYSGYRNNFVKSCDEVEEDVKRKKKKKHKIMEEREVCETLDDMTVEKEKKKKSKKKKREREEACSRQEDVQTLVDDTEALLEEVSKRAKKKKKRSKESEENTNDYEPKQKKKKKKAWEESTEEASHRKKEKRKEKRNYNVEHLQQCSKEAFNLASVHPSGHVKAF